MPVPSLHERLTSLARQSGRIATPAAASQEDWPARVESLRLALRARERTRRSAVAALPGEEVAPGVRRIRHLERDPPPPSLDFPWERAGLEPATGPLLLIDTETTGLAGGTGTLVFLLGLAEWTDDGLLVDQWLLTSPSAEPAWLAALSARVPSDAVLVSFNGRAFDLPLLATRHRMHRRPDPFAGLAHVDLLAPLRRGFATRWPDCRLATAEQRLLGQERVNDLPGAFAPVAYQAFLRGQDRDGLVAVLAHNRRDVIALAHLLPALARVFAAPLEYGADALAIADRLALCGRAGAAERILRGSSHDGAAHRLARLLRRERRWAEAIAALQPLVQRERACPVALEALAKIHEHVQQDPAAAALASRRLIELEPAQPRHLARLARLERRLRQAQARTL